MLQRGKEEAVTTATARRVRKPATNPIAWALEKARQAAGEAEGLSVVDGESHPCMPGAVIHSPPGRGGGPRSAGRHVPKGSGTLCPPRARGDPGLSSMAMQTRCLQHLTCFPATGLPKFQRSIAAKMIEACYKDTSP